MIRFLAGRGGTEEDLFAGTRNQPSVNEFDARFALAILALSKGDRQRARMELRECDETNAKYWEDYWWARAFERAMRDGGPWALRLPADKE